MPRNRETIVLGAGVAGLAAARRAQDLASDVVVLDGAPSPGGLTRTIEIDGFAFDYTGHFLHLCQYDTPADIPYAGQKEHEWMRVDRQSRCLVAGHLIPAPIQYNLAALPEDLLRKVRDSYERRPIAEESKAATFRDFVISGFGEELAELFLIPQNEKTMAISLDRLSRNAIKRFFPPPNDELVRRGMEAISESSEYNSTFWYPTLGGIQSLTRGMAAGIHDLRLNHRVQHVDLSKRTLTTYDHKEIEWGALFVSMPLNRLCSMSGDRELERAGEKLTAGRVIAFNYGIEGSVPELLEGVHWIYVPDRGVPFFRVGFYSNISAGTCAPGFHSMYVEVSVAHGEAEPATLELEQQVIAHLEKLGWLDPGRIRAKAIHRLDPAYVHHTPERVEVIDSILSRLRDADVHPIGRYGTWDYVGMEDSIVGGMKAVEEVLG